MRICLQLLLLIPLASACVGPSPARLTRAQDHMVVVKTVRLPDYMDWYVQFAEHTWIEMKAGSESSWTRLEVQGRVSGVEISGISEEDARSPVRWDRPVSILATLVGAEAQQVIPGLRQAAAEQHDYGKRSLTRMEDGSFFSVFQPPEGRRYNAWPGPNSNTFVVELLERTPELQAELHHNAVGKDYPRGFRMGLTTAGYGVEMDSAYLGLGLGMRQGLEFRIAQLTWGISLWPPAIKLPFLPRIGIHQGWVGAAPGSLD